MTSVPDTGLDYYLLLTDVRSSTEAYPPGLQAAFDRLGQVLPKLNQRHREAMALPLSVNYGDEVSGLFISATPLYDVLSTIRDALYPDACLRFAATKGRIAIASHDIRQVGGSVFKDADAAIGRLKRKRLFCSWSFGHKVLDGVLTSLTELSNTLIEDMTDNQRGVFVLARGRLKGVEVAERLGVSSQAASSAAVRGRVDLVLDAELRIREVLTMVDGEPT